MMPRWVGWWLLASVGVGCTGEFTSPPAPGTRDGIRPRCVEIAERLRVAPSSATVAAGQLFVLTPSGGTGRYRWRLSENASGGEVAPNAGLYVAGEVQPGADPTVDRVVLGDADCRGEATATITVVEGARIAPARVVLEPGQRVTFRVESAREDGTYSFAMATAGSGGTVTAEGAYVAGSRTGRDVVRLSDLELGTTADALVDVVADASLSVTPSQWVIPVGTAVSLPVEGGSGDYEVSVSGGAVVHEGGTAVRAMADGTSTVTITDPNTSSSVAVTVRAVEPQEASRRQPGDLLETHVTGGALDLGDDGDLDLVVGMPDASSAWFGSGRVLIYENDGGTLGAPLELSGTSRDEEYGSAIAIADLDGDGREDILVGARRADPIRRDVGAVYVYAGADVDAALADDALALRPRRSFFGANSSDLFGASIAVCDFNADGLLDVAVGAPFGQDADGASDQGVVHLFVARSGHRFISAPDELLLGEVPAPGGARAAVASLRLGGALAAGDFDGDGACDLAAHARGLSDAQLDTGMVALYRGRPIQVEVVDGRRVVLDLGGLERTPARIWGRADGMDDDGRFGEHLALEDVNGDGAADLLAGRHLFDGAAGGDSGAAYLFFGGASSGAADTVTDIGAADWSVEGASNADRVGQAVMLFDVNGDGRADIVSGDSRAEIPDAELDRPGLVNVYFGGSAPSRTPDRTYEGPSAGARLGYAAAAIGDLDGDGESDVVAFAPYYDGAPPDEGEDRGGLFFGASRDRSIRELPMTFPASGQRVGDALAWVDLNADGMPELAVGASQTDVDGLGRNVGSVRIYAGTATGVSPTPRQELVGFTGHSGSDELGWTLARAGDVDGDGNEDLAVLARSEDLPNGGLDGTLYDADPACEVRRDNPGALLVFRGLGDGSLAPEPAFAIFGPEANQRFEAIAGGVDINADGFDDLILGSREWDGPGTNAGGVEVFFGRAAAADGRILALCTPDIHVDGTPGERLGHAVAALGDLDGDGCGDFGAGAPEADPGDVRNSGAVHVFFGFAALGVCADTALRAARLDGAFRDAQAGSAIAGGVDVTGDGVPDLVVGASQFRDSRGEVGRALLVSGAYAASRVGASGPLVESSVAAAFVDGFGAGEELGTAVALAALPGGGGVAILGGPFGSSTGRVDTGGAVVYAVGADGFGAALVQVSGESLGQSEVGSSVAAIHRGGRTYVAVGARWSRAVEVDDGASYAFTIGP